MVLVGSAAASHWYSEYRVAKDHDLIGKEGENRLHPVGAKRIDFHNLPNPVYNKLEEFSCDGVVNPVGLYTLKLSHAFWDIAWKKTAEDIIFFQERNIVYDKDLFEMLYGFWVQRHGQKRAYLNKTNEAFFKDVVSRKYVHDSLHLAMAYYDRPLYEKIKKDKSKALTNEKMFNHLSPTDRLRLCREEIYVTALERFLIPLDFKADPTISYRRAINKLVTSMSKGWFPRWIMINLSSLWSPDLDYVNLFKIGLINNTIIPLKSKPEV